MEESEAPVSRLDETEWRLLADADIDGLRLAGFDLELNNDMDRSTGCPVIVLARASQIEVSSKVASG